MAAAPIQSWPRLWTLGEGTAMVVTDLHGDWEAYERCRSRFVDLRARGQADYLIFTGDLIHSSAAVDHSLEIVLDILALRREYGAAVIYLCGNHELPHIYHFRLSKGGHEYTPAFEAELSASGQRQAVRELFESLPFYIRTAAGVTLAHAGAPLLTPDHIDQLFAWDHRALLAWADEALAGADLASLRRGYAALGGGLSYAEEARIYLAASGPADPRYNDLLRGFLITGDARFRLLRAALFTACELEQGEAAYGMRLARFLKQAGRGFAPQRALVAGHLVVHGGHRLVAGSHLRLASARHATPREAGQYLLFDTAQPISAAEDLLAGLRSVFDAPGA